MSQSNNTMKEGNVVQPLHGSGSSLSIQSQPPKTKPPSIDALTVQCNSCLKWRVMPSMEKYEEVREQLLDKPFYCETACEWEPGMSCDVPEDISRYETSLWAFDRPSIPRSPAGWKRSLQIRSEGCSRFCDVYYFDPSGKKFRSSAEVEKHLKDHPQHITEGVNISQFSFQTPIPTQFNNISQFSFQTPIPTQFNYVRKRPPRPSKRIRRSELSSPCDDLASQE